MPDKTCPQCSETVDEAKAFCPGCGHSFIDEQQRAETSRYEQADHTMQMGQTMYNNMLSDMGLNLKKEPEKRVEVLKPAVPATQVLQPVAGTQQTAAPSTAEPLQAETKSRKSLWITLAIIAGILIIFGIIAVIAVVILLFRFGKL